MSGGNTGDIPDAGRGLDMSFLQQLDGAGDDRDIPNLSGDRPPTFTQQATQQQVPQAPQQLEVPQAAQLYTKQAQPADQGLNPFQQPPDTGAKQDMLQPAAREELGIDFLRKQHTQEQQQQQQQTMQHQAYQSTVSSYANAPPLPQCTSWEKYQNTALWASIGVLFIIIITVLMRKK